MSEIPYTPYWFCPIIKTIYQTIQVSSEVVFNDSNTEQMNDFTHFVLISTFYINIMLQKHLPPKNDWWKVIFFFLTYLQSQFSYIVFLYIVKSVV